MTTTKARSDADRSATGRLPNFLHIGPGKAGSTWLHEVLSRHEQVHLSEAKDLYFFSRYYERGLDWYREQFAQAGAQPVVGEISPDYLSHPGTAERIRASLGPGTRLMVTLRDPVDRAFSSYLYLAKHGLAADSFRETLDTVPLVLEEGRYCTLLHRYLEQFDRDRLHIAMFDDLQADPQAFLDDVTDWLGIDRQPLEAELRKPVLAASTARWLPIAALSRRTADFVRTHNGADFVGRVKRAKLVQRMLYRPLGPDRPTPSADDVNFIRKALEAEVVGVERDFGLPLRERWGWL